MSTELTPVVIGGLTFAYVGGIVFLAVGVFLSIRRGRLHPLLLVSISAISFSWIEAPYDWAMYAQFPPALPRMPSWWPMNMTWGGGLPSAVPIGYIAYFVLPGVIGAALGRRAAARFGWRRPGTLLTVGWLVGFCWALFFNAFVGARLGVFYYGYVIPGLAIFEGTKHQYPIYDAIAMGVQVMVFAYLLGRTDSQGRNVIEAWSDKMSRTRVQSTVVSIAAVVVVGHLVYGAVFAPHLVTKLSGYVTSGPTEQLFPGVPNQPR
ncbi:spirocyclase AveC family protein [Mycobacterium deserti]|uniref:Spirocyclase AveC family protein n=1 Tax=Mycobacterium deserti TaxID=2978347 RepID=A0ABT2ME79_9MYCO|nr:spirocyclase AveC family protein [Mycobacterium deserti]MCT7659296.1 spirocyclase AveC family protein [Mycobacterium deserti]